MTKPNNDGKEHNTSGNEQLEYGDCFWCVGTGKIKSGFIQRLFGFDDCYECPICNGDGRHVGDFQFSRPNGYRPVDTATDKRERQ